MKSLREVLHAICGKGNEEEPAIPANLSEAYVEGLRVERDALYQRVEQMLEVQTGQMGAVREELKRLIDQPYLPLFDYFSRRWVPIFNERIRELASTEREANSGAYLCKVTSATATAAESELEQAFTCLRRADRWLTDLDLSEVRARAEARGNKYDANALLGVLALVPCRLSQVERSLFETPLLMPSTMLSREVLTWEAEVGVLAFMESGLQKHQVRMDDAVKLVQALVQFVQRHLSQDEIRALMTQD